MAHSGEFSQITSISTVSGASLVMAAILSQSDHRWPTQEAFINSTLPKVKSLILTQNLQHSALSLLPWHPRYWRHRVNMLAKMLQDKWGVAGTLQTMPRFPYWEINCTTFETGNNFRIRWDYMGDEKVGYVKSPTLPISHVVAASAAFPVLIGPYILETKNLNWTYDKQGKIPKTPLAKSYTLWDGGVYDNLGLEPLYKKNGQFDKEINHLIVSDAGASLTFQERRGNISVSNLRRLLDISSNQVNTLRVRQIKGMVVKQRTGRYISITQAAQYPTTLNAPTPEDFDTIFNDGYANAKSS